MAAEFCKSCGHATLLHHDVTVPRYFYDDNFGKCNVPGCECKIERPEYITVASTPYKPSLRTRFRRWLRNRKMTIAYWLEEH